MTDREKMNLLEEMMEMENGALSENTVLGELEGWDSMAALSLIVLMEDEFGKKLSGEQIIGFKNVKDILDFMG